MNKLVEEIIKPILEADSKITKIVYSQGFFNLFGYIKKILIIVIGFFRVIPREPTSFSDMKIWSQKSIALACQN